MAFFKVGDRVKITGPSVSGIRDYIGRVGIITSFTGADDTVARVADEKSTTTKPFGIYDLHWLYGPLKKTKRRKKKIVASGTAEEINKLIQSHRLKLDKYRKTEKKAMELQRRHIKAISMLFAKLQKILAVAS